MLQPFSFDSPETIEEVCLILNEKGGRVIAGGTDVIPQMRDGRFHATHLVDLSRLKDLSYIKEIGNRFHIGGLTNYQAIMTSNILNQEAKALVEAAALVGGVQTRVRGTIAGNIGNASPAGDTLPPLLAFDAAVSLVSMKGSRKVSLADLLLGPGLTDLRENEVITEICFDRQEPETRSIFLRLGKRRGMAISIVSVAALLRVDKQGNVRKIAIALGAVAPKAVRCPQSEALLLGQPLTSALIDQAAAQAVAECAPIDDVRGSAVYRKHGVRILVRRALTDLAQSFD